MSRFLYGANGQPLNRDIRLEKILGEEPQQGAQAMEIGDTAVGTRTAKLEKVCLVMAGSLVQKMRTEELQKRQLASGLLVFTLGRDIHLEPGIEAVMPPDDTVAFNFSDLLQPPEGTTLHQHDHTMWVAQQLIDYDFGVQKQEQLRASRNY